MKKVASLFLVLLLLFSLCGADVYAEDGSVIDDNDILMDLTGGVVTGFVYENIFSEFTLESYEKGNLENLYFQIETIDKALDCTVLLDGQPVSALCTAVWNIGDLPLESGGIYNVTATLTPPDGCTFADGVRQEIVMPIQIIDPDGEPVLITSIEDWLSNCIAIAVPVGDTIDAVANHVDLEDLLIECTDENGSSQKSTVEWDYTTVDMNTPGLYQVTGALKPPLGLVFAPELPLPTPVFTVSVQTLGSPDINCYSRGRNSLIFPWLLTEKQSEQLDLFSVWLSVDGVWSRLESGYGLLQDYLQIHLPLLSVGHNYELQVDYPGGHTGILTFTYDGKTLDSDYSQGDRDGDDSHGNEPPAIVQPPPLPDGGEDGNNNESNGNKGNGGSSGSATAESGDTSNSTTTLDMPTSEPTPTPILESAPPVDDPSPTHTEGTTAQTIAPTLGKTDAPALRKADAPTPSKADGSVFMEESNATTTIISGRRLRLMLEADKGLQFFKQGISVILPRDAVETLNLADDDVFSIEILRKSDNTFYFKVMVNDSNVAELVNTTVSLPYTPSSEVPNLTLQQGKQKLKTTGNYDPQSGLATFVVDAPGHYTILDETVPTAASPDDAKKSKAASTPIRSISLVVGCLLALVCGVWLFKRRSVK